MRFIMIRKADEETEAGALPTRELVEAMGRYHDEMVSAGVLLTGEGLHPTRNAVRVSFSGGRPTVIDGPFTETKELVAGFTVIQVDSREEALEWAKRWPPLDGGGKVQIELRQVYEAEDFGEEFTADMKAMQEQLRTGAAANR